MWARTLRSTRSLARRRMQSSRRQYNGQPEHQTYFQEPRRPPQQQRRRILRTVVFGTACIGIGAYGYSRLSNAVSVMDMDEINEAMSEEMLAGGTPLEHAMRLLAGTDDENARHVPYTPFHQIQRRLEIASQYSVSRTAIGHSCSFASNQPCEDVHSSGMYHFFNNPAKEWLFWSIYDGHAGPRTAHALKMYLPAVVGEELWNQKCMSRPYMSNDSHITQVIKQAFEKVDEALFQGALEHLRHDEYPDLALAIHNLAGVTSGSCALMAIFDQTRGVLRVANTGDSRAVLGRWDRAARKYVAQPMSFDQTGFNKDEVERIRREHPGEDVVDPKSGRVHGIAVSRAFGDSRWKLPNDVSKRISETFWGPTPRPDALIKTPPYLTAEPEVMDIKVETGEHPDFLIMGSDGLWDCISSEDAVICVQQWLGKYTPTSFADRPDPKYGLDTLNGHPLGLEEFPPGRDEDEDTYYHEGEKSMRWRVSPRHFVVEDENAGLHLIKNAFGGKRRNLFRAIMTIQPPLSRSVRDDVTVQVVFFGTTEKDERQVMESRAVVGERSSTRR